MPRSSATLPFPPEIRNAIYCQLFRFQQTVEIVVNREDNFAAGYLVPKYPDGSTHRNGSFYLVGSSAAPLLRVSRQTSAEARAVLYGANTFFLNLRYTYSPETGIFGTRGRDITDAFGSTNASLIRRGSTSLVAGALFESVSGGTGLERGKAAAERVLARFPSLEALDMHLEPSHMPVLLPHLFHYGQARWIGTGMVPEGERSRYNNHRNPNPRLRRGSDGQLFWVEPPGGWVRVYDVSEFARQLAGSGSRGDNLPDVATAVAAAREIISGFASAMRSSGRQVILRTIMRQVVTGAGGGSGPAYDVPRSQRTQTFLDELSAATAQEGWEEIGTEYISETEEDEDEEEEEDEGVDE